MLQLFQSNRTEVLVTLVASQIRENPLPSPFLQEHILVQSPGMSQWLKLELAEKNGIAANIAFPLPSSFIWGLYQKLLPNVPKQSPFNKDRLTWRVEQCLKSLPNNEVFADLVEYINGGAETTQRRHSVAMTELRRFRLAEKIADVFDNYLMYRPHWLSHWELGHDDLPDQGLQTEFSDLTNSVAWQAQLWRSCQSLISQSVEGSSGLALHRAELHRQALNVLKTLDERQVDQLLPKRLFIFGVTSLNQQQLELFDELSKKVDVQLFQLNPCKEYWGDVVSAKTIARMQLKESVATEKAESVDQQYYITGNPLVASWGKVGKDNAALLQEFSPEQQEFYIETNAKDSRLLAAIQEDILELRYRQQTEPMTPEELISDIGKRELVNGDDSLTVQRCHSPVRELEVLKDQLIRWFNSEDYSPKDIIVMVPDINQYAPFIESVFGVDEEQSGLIPYAIADQSDLSQHPILQGFLSLLLLPQSRFNATDILDLLEIPQISRKFELDSQDLVVLKRWLSEVHVRWGIDQKHKQNWDLPAFDTHTWMHGLRALVAGLSLRTSGLWQQVYANPVVEGLEAELLAKLLDFISFLVEKAEQFSQPATLNQWQGQGSDLIAQLFDGYADEPNESIVVEKLRGALARVSDYQNNGDYDGKVHFPVVHQLLQQQLSQSGVNQSFLAGKVNFCSLMPMRSVPFDVICVLGLNESDYPRRVEPISFDLVAQFPPRRGDRSRKLDERYLFLEAICSARRKFYCSYVGFSIKDNSVMMPSVVLSELLDYIDDSFVSAAEQKATSAICRNHKLQPFASEYFDSEEKDLSSFNKKWASLAKNVGVSTGLEGTNSSPDKELLLHGRESTGVTRIESEQLLRFWRHPVKYFYLNQLEANLEFAESTTVDIEVFAHDGLSKYQQLAIMVEQGVIGTSDFDNNVALQCGTYPNGEWGQSLLEQYQAVAESVIVKLNSVLDHQTSRIIEPVSFELTDIADTTVAVNLELYAGVNVLIRPGKVRFIDKHLCWIQHLLLCSLRPVCSLVASIDDKWQLFKPLPQVEAKVMLSDYIKPFIQSQSNQLYIWHPDIIALLAKKPDLDSPEMLQPEISKLFEVNTYTRNLNDDVYALRHREEFTNISTEQITTIKAQLQAMDGYMIQDKPVKLREAMGEQS